jgi:lipoyl(octanoyl) transferase
VRRWIAYHGLAVNVQPDLRHYDLIVPCGIADRGVTSLAAVTGRRYDMAAEMRRLARAFAAVFPGATIVPDDAESRGGDVDAQDG